MFWSEEKGCSNSCNSGLDGKVGVGVGVCAINPPIWVSVGVSVGVREISACADTEGDMVADPKIIKNKTEIRIHLNVERCDFIKILQSNLTYPNDVLIDIFVNRLTANGLVYSIGKFNLRIGLGISKN
jgi:hypothetical protein